VNKYRLNVQEQVDVLEIDNSRVREQQVARINNIKQTRDNTKVFLLMFVHFASILSMFDIICH